MDLKAIKTGSWGEEELHIRQLMQRFEDVGHLSPDIG